MRIGNKSEGKASYKDSEDNRRKLKGERKKVRNVTLSCYTLHGAGKVYPEG